MLVWVVLAILASSCLGSNEGKVGANSAREQRSSQPTAVAMAPTPTAALRLCQRSKLLRPICPPRLPKAPWPKHLTDASLSLCRGGEGACRAFAWDEFSLQWGAESPGHPEQNRPTGIERVGAPGGIVHVVLYAGKLGGPKGTHSGPSDSAFAFDWPKNHRASAIRNGLLREKRTEAVFLGRFRWAGRSGSLVLAPPEELGGIVGDHIVFRWRRKCRVRAFPSRLGTVH
jgi:hypothetical protein